VGRLSHDGRRDAQTLQSGRGCKLRIGPGIAVPESQGAQPTLAVLAGRLVLWLWRGPDRPIGLRWVRLRGDEPELGPEEGSAIPSMVPVAAVEAARGDTHDHWLATMDPVGRNQARIELRRLGLDSSDRLRTMHREAVSGTFSPRRLTLVWQPERGLDLDGRLYVFGGGVYGIPNQIGPSEQPWAEQIVSMNVGAQGRTAGWLHRRYYGNTHPGDFASRSAPGACAFGQDIAYVSRLRDDNPDRNDRLLLGFFRQRCLRDRGRFQRWGVHRRSRAQPLAPICSGIDLRVRWPTLPGVDTPGYTMTPRGGARTWCATPRAL